MNNIEERLATIEKKLDLLLAEPSRNDVTQKWAEVDRTGGKFLDYEYRNGFSGWAFHYQQIIQRYGGDPSLDTWSNRDMYIFAWASIHNEDRARQIMIDCLKSGDIKGTPVNLKLYDYYGTTVWGADLETGDSK